MNFYRDKREISWTKSFQKLYIPTHTNAGNYFIGVLSGFLYYKYRDMPSKDKLLKTIRILFYICVVVGIINFQMSCIFYFFKFEKPAIWISIYAIIARHLWGVSGIILMFASMFKATSKLDEVLLSCLLTKELILHLFI